MKTTTFSLAALRHVAQRPQQALIVGSKGNRSVSKDSTKLGVGGKVFKHYGTI